jgi:hypothetical protein
LTKGQFAAHCESEGITYEKTVPEAPSQNGVAERCNLTLASMARAMLIDSDLSDWFWPFAIQAAVHIKNRVPHSNLPPHKTPFEFWHGYKPNLSHLRHFGAYCTSRITPSNALQKFDPRGESGQFLSYAKDAKGYLVWVPNPGGHGGALKTRRDVIFHGLPIPAPAPSVHDDLTPLWDDVVTTDQPVQWERPYALCAIIYNDESLISISDHLIIPTPVSHEAAPTSQPQGTHTGMSSYVPSTTNKLFVLFT